MSQREQVEIERLKRLLGGTGGAALAAHIADTTNVHGHEDGATADQTDAEIETAYNNQVAAASTVEAAAGTETAIRRWSPERIADAIAALGGGGGNEIELRYDIGDETTAITTTGIKYTGRLESGVSISSVAASLTTACTTGTFTIDVEIGGATIFSTTPTFDATEKTTATAAVPAVISSGVHTLDDEITIHVDNVGDSNAAGLKVVLIGLRVSPKATGGTITEAGGYFYHTFTSSGTFTPTEPIDIEYLIVGGGGGGGGEVGGGGGAGGFVTGTDTGVASALGVTVGAAGAAGTGSTNGTEGGDSILGAYTTADGGGGGSNGTSTSQRATDGGSGGGGGIRTNYNFVGSATVGQGNDGGTGASTSSAEDHAGGGGGAGAVGGNGDGTANTAGAGGAGDEWPAASGDYYAGGGGGANWDGSAQAAGGTGGGGYGYSSAGGAPAAGTTNTGGGGGGGGGGGASGAAGGSGIVIVRYSSS